MTSDPASDAALPELRALSVLPARREDIELHTADELTLVGELALPVDRPPRATLITLHPLPTHGGFMDSHVLRKAAWRLPALAGLAVLRFNTRGTVSARGRSEGHFSGGVGEHFDVVAAIEADLAAWDELGKPLVVIVRELDDYLRPDEARRRFSLVRQAEVIEVDGAKHLWVGEAAVRRVLDEIVAHVAPGIGPLPTVWDGTMVTAGQGEAADDDEQDHTTAPPQNADGTNEGEDP